VAEAIIAAAGRTLDLGGVFFISVPVSSCSTDEYVLAHVRDGRRVEDPLQPDEFDRLADTSSGGRLPTRKFALPQLIRRLGEAAFHIDDVLAYHFHAGHASWPPIPCIADVRNADVDGVIDVAVLSTRA
jgi:hypothetical protein